MEFAKTIITILAVAMLMSVMLSAIYNEFFEGQDED